MKKYLLLLGCACMALAVLADDVVIAKAPSSDLINLTDIIAEKVVSPTNPIEHGGKPRRPKSTPVGGCSSTSINRVYHPGDLMETDGGKKRVRKGIEDSGIPVRPGTFVYCSSGDGSTLSIDKRFVKEFIENVTNGGRGRKEKGGIESWRPVTGNGSVIASSAGGDSDKLTIADVTDLIDQLLKGEAKGKSIGDVTMMIDQILTSPKD